MVGLAHDRYGAHVDHDRLRGADVKCLVIVKDGQIVLRSTPGVETACIVDGEDVDLPDDWADLPIRVVHSMPITIEKDAFEQNDAPYRAPQCPETQLTAPNTQVHHATARNGGMKAPYCYDCDSNHPAGIGCDGLPKTCSCCGATYGQMHKGGCADQNALVEGGDIVR